MLISLSLAITRWGGCGVCAVRMQERRFPDLGRRKTWGLGWDEGFQDENADREGELKDLHLQMKWFVNTGDTFYVQETSSVSLMMVTACEPSRLFSEPTSLKEKHCIGTPPSSVKGLCTWHVTCSLSELSHVHY